MNHHLTRILAAEQIADLERAAGAQRLASTRPARRRLPVILAITAALGTAAGPAHARPFDTNAQGSIVTSVSTPAGTPAAQRTGPCSQVCAGHGHDLGRATRTATPRASAGNDLGWAYVTIGAGAGGLALLGAGGTVARRRARRDAAQQPTIAA